MLSLNDVLLTINGSGGRLPDAVSVSPKVMHTLCRFRMAVTDNLHATRTDFTKKYGAGNAYIFPVNDYKHGKQLATDMYNHFNLSHIAPPDKPSPFAPDALLYLLVYVMEIGELEGEVA